MKQSSLKRVILPSEATQRSQSSIDSSQDIDMAKVQEIRDAIREGRLEVRADRIADGLIANLKDQ